MLSSVWLCSMRVGFFHSFYGNLRFCHHCMPHIGLFSAPLPVISDYPSPDRTSCVEGGVSSAVAAYRAPAHIQTTDLIEFEYYFFVFFSSGFVPIMNKVPNSLFHFFLLFKSLMCFVFTSNPVF